MFLSSTTKPGPLWEQTSSAKVATRRIPPIPQGVYDPLGRNTRNKGVWVDPVGIQKLISDISRIIQAAGFHQDNMHVSPTCGSRNKRDILQAIHRGLQLAGPKFADFLDALQEIWWSSPGQALSTEKSWFSLGCSFSCRDGVSLD